MKTIRLVILALFSLLIATGPVFAQQDVATTQTKPPTVTPVPVGFVNTQAFENGKGGIARYINALNSIETEFQTRDNDLKNMSARINTLQNEVQIAKSATILAAKQEELARLQREFNFKQEEATAAYRKRRDEVAGPIMQDIGNELSVFAKQNGIKVLLDVSKFTDALLVWDESADMTDAFVSYYNAKKPATGQITTATTKPTTTPTTKSTTVTKSTTKPTTTAATKPTAKPATTPTAKPTTTTKPTTPVKRP